LVCRDYCKAKTFKQKQISLQGLLQSKNLLTKINWFAGITAKQKPLNKNKLVCRDEYKVKSFKQK